MVDTTALKEVENILDSLEVLQHKAEAIPNNLNEGNPRAQEIGFTGESVRKDLLAVIKNSQINCVATFYFFMSTFLLTEEFDRKRYQQLQDRIDKIRKTF